MGHDMDSKALKDGIKSVPLLGDLLVAIYGKLFMPKPVNFQNSSQYWQDRYQAGGNSGAGSYSRLAHFKAEILNDFVRAHDVRSVVEFGSGDGAQLTLAQYPRYIGYDVSAKAVELCSTRFAGDSTKEFHLAEASTQPMAADLSLSLDVIYHLVEDEVFDRYMNSLFSSAERFVIIYSSNRDENVPTAHVRHRAFLPWIERNQPDWVLDQAIPNKYPFRTDDPNNTSFADFYIFTRRG
jgi:hypothetical protein